MPKISAGRAAAILFFLIVVIGAGLSLQRMAEDIFAEKYFNQPQELYQEIIFLSSYILIILLALRYGYYLAIDRVNWQTIRDDFLYLLNRRYFSKTQWVLNVLLFWLTLAGFVLSLALSTMKGNL